MKKVIAMNGRGDPMNDLISKLSEIRSNYNCLDEKEEPYYRALSEAIQLVSVQPELAQDLHSTCADAVSRQAAIDVMCSACWDWCDEGVCKRVSALQQLSPTQPDLSAYSDKLWKTAYERGKREAQQEQGDEAIFWKKRAKEYEDIVTNLVAAQAKGIKLDSITITEEGITFKKSQSERKCGKWINDEHDMPRCSCCGYMPEYNRHIDDYYYSDYCPNCGADMRGGDEDGTDQGQICGADRGRL